MFLDKHISQRQKRGILVCLPKSTSPRTPEDYRPISLLTTEYKLLARILAGRLRHILADQLRKPFLRCTGKFHIGRYILCTRRPCPRRGHRNSVVSLNIGLSTGILSHPTSIFIQHITPLWDKSLVCGAHTCLVRPGNGVDANKLILRGQHTDTQRRKTRLPLSVASSPCVCTPLYAHLKIVCPVETTDAKRARHCLCRRCDGLFHKPWGLQRNVLRSGYMNGRREHA